ncbi:MAG: hypothetical protein WC458_02620 [Patescibacteria group bacterium]
MFKKNIVVFSASVLVIFFAFLAVKAAPSITSTLTFSGVTNDIQTTGNDDLVIMPGGTGNVGIGTTNPLAKLSVRASSNDWQVRFIGSHADYRKVVVLLHAAYNGTLLANNYCVGKIFMDRGGASAGNRKEVAEINTGSAYNYDLGVHYSTGYALGRLVTVSYNGVKYVAYELPYSASLYERIDFEGYIHSSAPEELKIVEYYNTQNSTVINSEINNSITAFTNGNYNFDSSNALFTGNVGVGTDAPAEKLDVNGSIAIQGKRAFLGYDSWLRINEGNYFTSGIYAGSGIFRTDGNFQVGGGGSLFTVLTTGRVGIGTGTPGATLEVLSSDATSILAGSKRIGNLDIPLASTDAATKGYVDGAILASVGSVNFVSRQPDGDRIASNILPTTSPHGVRFDFVAASTVGTGGNYAGVMTFAPWAGTSASTGDASYQFAFGSSATNGSGVPQLNIRNGIDSTWNSWRKVITDDGAGNILVSGNIMRTTHSNGFLLGSYNNVGSNDGKSNPIYTIGSNYMPGDTSLGNMYGIGYSHSNFWGSGKSTGWGLYTAEAGVIHNTISDGGIWTAGSISAVGNIYPNNQTTYGLRGNDVYADTINTGVAGDQLEVNYRTAGPVKICATAGCATYSAFFGTNGRVGIGTDSPGTTLDVNGSFRGVSDNSYFSLDSSADRIGFVKKSGYVGKLAYGSGNSFAITQSGATTIVPGSTFTDRFVLDSTGNVEITGSGSVEKLKITGTGQSNLTLNGTLGQIQNSAGALYITNDAATDIIFRSSASTENMRIASDGNVSISRGNLSVTDGFVSSVNGFTSSSGNLLLASGSLSVGYSLDTTAGVKAQGSSYGVYGYSSGASGYGVYGSGVYGVRGVGTSYGAYTTGLVGIRAIGNGSGGTGGSFSGDSYGITTNSCSGCSVLAEMVPVAETPNNGDIMCMNPISGKVEICREDKSSRLKGIAQKMAETVMRMGCSKTLDAKNGENSVHIGVMDVDAWQKDPACKGWYPIALSGLSEQTNVVCKSPQGKPLQYGDILVSSAIPGHLRPLDEGEEVAAYQIAGKSDSICSTGKETDSIMVWIQ